MRALEAVLLLANLLAFFGLVAPLPLSLRWMRHSVPVALLVASVQALVEGARWQMVLAYALTGLFFLAWLVAGIVIIGWGSRTLVRYRNARVSRL